MTATIIIGVVLTAYTVYVVRKKIRDMKNGKFCSCDCGNCSASCKKRGGEVS